MLRITLILNMFKQDRKKKKNIWPALDQSLFSENTSARHFRCMRSWLFWAVTNQNVQSWNTVSYAVVNKTYWAGISSTDLFKASVQVCFGCIWSSLLSMIKIVSKSAWLLWCSVFQNLLMTLGSEHLLTIVRKIADKNNIKKKNKAQDAPEYMLFRFTLFAVES